MTSFALVVGLLCIMAGGHIAWRPARGSRALLDAVAACALVYAGFTFIQVHERLRQDEPPAAPAKRWEQPI